MSAADSAFVGLSVLVFPPVVASALLVLYISVLFVKRWVDNCSYDLDYARTAVLDKRLKKILQKPPSSIDETEAQKSECFPCLKKRNIEEVPTMSPLQTLNKFGEATDADADEVLPSKLLVSTVGKELQDIIRLLARILAGRRKVSEWKIPLRRWNARVYLLSLISPDSSLDSAKRKHLVSVPLSIAHIQEKLREGRDEEASEGAQLAIAAQLKIAAFEGAQLAIVYKAIQVVEAKIVTQWNISLQILKITAYAIVTIFSFYYVGLNGDRAVVFLVLNVVADTISSMSTTSFVDFVIPGLSAGMDNLVREIEFHLKRMALNKEQEVNDWLKTYFDEYNKMQRLLSSDNLAYKGSIIERAGLILVNATKN